MLTVIQVKAARLLLGWSQADLARAADVSAPTIVRLEAAGDPLGCCSETGSKIRAALEAAGIEFTNGSTPGAGARLVRDKLPSKILRFDTGDKRRAGVVGG